MDDDRRVAEASVVPYEGMADSGQRVPHIIIGVPDVALADFVTQNRTSIMAKLMEEGAIIFRGFEVEGRQGFDRFAKGISDNRADYTYRSTPRTALGENVFTATEYPQSEQIPLHSENSYQTRWPLLISFFCEIVAETGGQTSLADLRRVSSEIDAHLLRKFSDNGVEYIRHYRPYVDIPWQIVFQTEQKSEVEKYCADNGIKFDWLDDGTLRTSQICQGTAAHPVTGEKVFFNQAHLFHVSSLGEDAASALLDIFGEGKLPRHARFGNGDEISEAELAHVRAAFDRCATNIHWQRGDVALIDNMQFAHGRRPFTGPRTVLTIMLDPYEGADGDA